MVLRSPIIVTVGHSDHGKTTLLDRIRGTAVTKLEPGQLTQHTGASYVPADAIRKSAGKLLDKFKVKLEVPGLLFIDTPGHKAFLGMRKRGGSISDLAILVVDLTEGFQEQTIESLNVLKEFKTPFIVAATKVDRLKGWFPQNNSSFLESFAKQRDDVKNDLENYVYKLVVSLAELGFDSERFDRIDNFAKQIAVVPVSSSTGEGISDLLVMLSGLAQHFLKDRLQVSDRSRGSILEIKESRGLGTTADVILYDGVVRKTDYAVIGASEPIVVNIRALLRPQPMRDIRTEKTFESVDEVAAAAGIRISGPGIEKALSGSPVIFVHDETGVQNAVNELRKEVQEIQFSKKTDGIIINADTLGSLEAMIKILEEAGIPIRRAEVGAVTHQELVELQNSKEKLNKVILAFNAPVPDDIGTSAKDLGIKVFSGDIVYRIIDEYKQWVQDERSSDVKKKLDLVTRPAMLKILKGTVFRQSNPAVFGVEVVSGFLRNGVIVEKGGKSIDKIKEMQKEGKVVTEAKKGDKLAISMDGVTIGRQLIEGDVLRVRIPDSDKPVLKSLWGELSEDERQLLS